MWGLHCAQLSHGVETKQQYGKPSRLRKGPQTWRICWVLRPAAEGVAPKMAPTARGWRGPDVHREILQSASTLGAV